MANRKIQALCQPRAQSRCRGVCSIGGDIGSKRGVRGLKLGRGLPGLTRPDKLVAYFGRLDDLQEAGAGLHRRLGGCPVHGVPFTAELSSDGLLSWGADRPRTVPGQPESWRLWIASRLAGHFEQREEGMSPAIMAVRARPATPRWHERGYLGAYSGVLVVTGRRNMIEGLFTMPKDIRLDPIESLPHTVLTGFEHKAGDFALTRPQSRDAHAYRQRLDGETLEIFREPVTITDAVIRFSRTEQADPAAILDEAFPVLRTLIEAGMLLPSDSHLASPIEFLIGRGELVGDLVVDQPVAVVIDTEVYRARASDGRWAALKIARPGSEGRPEEQRSSTRQRSSRSSMVPAARG